MKITKQPRKFVSDSLEITSWEVIKPYFEDLVQRPLNAEEDFEKWLADRSELDAVLEEEGAWRYIKMTINTVDADIAEAYNFFITKIQPEMAPFEDLLNRKMIECPFSKPEGKSAAYKIYERSVRTAIDLFNEQNIPLIAESSEKSSQYGAISGKQAITYQGQKITMQKASVYLKSIEQSVRKEVFELIVKRRKEDVEALDQLFTELVQLRHQIAINAGFENFRDYKFKALGRFDYTKEDCFEFHNSIKKVIVPIVKEIQLKKLSKMGISKFKPWDLDVDPEGKEPLKPFSTGNEMLQGTIKMFDTIDPYFGDCLRTMEAMNYLDLESKDGKAPGGYNYPLYEIGVPFIFMNAVGSHRDLVTMVHEGGHAIHSFLSRGLELTAYKNLPSEVAELASMSMELLSMEQWHEFYNNVDLIRAKEEQLETILKILPWIATIDEFQHWIYTNPNHSVEDRTAKWLQLGEEYGTGLTDYEGYEDVKASSWQRQLHLFEVPFYYIEYGIAQLGALQVWKNSIENFDQAIKDYKAGLELGYTESIPEIYKRANVAFDFSLKNMQVLANFIQQELQKLN